MPANQRQQPLQTPSSPAAKASSKYTNKDGSKFITIPKSINAINSPELSPAMAPTIAKPNGQTPVLPENSNDVLPAVNKKKQKRREKERAKLAAQQSANPQTNGVKSATITNRQMEDLEERFHNHGLQNSHQDNGRFDSVEGDPYDTDEADEYSASYGQHGSPANSYGRPTPHQPSKSPKKKKKGRNSVLDDHPSNPMQNGVPHNHVSLPIPPLAPTNVPRGPGISREKIWNTSSQEERERIKEFWLSLGEDERKSLVKVEKDAVLKKMKDQQKHSCSCTVCGRKRTAIEEELEVLYDAYYEELEQYANHQGESGIPPMMPPPRRFGALSGLQPPHRLPAAFSNRQPSRGRIVEQLGDDEDEEDEDYSDQGDEDDYSDEDEPEELPRTHAADFFNFGNSLTVQGGILTVADDLLKNDGKKFIEMMEQLAERRMAREEDARDQYNPSYGHPPNSAMHSHSHNHNHPPPVEEDEYDDEEDDEEYESGEEDDYDEDEEMDTMTEEQRMEEGRRMFQIFAARMFEQRVLTAYKEKIAKERQQKLLEELEEETRADSQKKAKKAKDAQKKKEKLAQKKQLLAEEKAKREADKATEEAAIRAAEQQKAEEQRQKAEEKRKKKEAQKKAEEEERQRKEADRVKRLQEQRERQADLDRKQREAKEKERKEKEGMRQKERDAKEAKEREIKERKEKQEREKREREVQVKLERQAREVKEKLAREELAAQKAITQAAQAAKRTQPPVPIPTNLYPHPIASPHVAVVTPAIPKAPTPIKLRTTSSQQESNSSLPTTPQNVGPSQNVSPLPSTPSQGSPGPIGHPGKSQTQPFLHQPQATSPIHSALKSPPGIQPSPFSGLPPMGLGVQQNGPPIGSFGRIPPDPMFPMMQPGRFGPMPVPNGMPFQPMHPQMAQGRGFPMPQPPPGFSHPMPGHLPGIFGGPKENGPIQSHSRQQSGSFEKPLENQPAQPIARPAPIGRPASVVHGQRQNESRKPDVDDLSLHLGSSALLDDSDEPLTSGLGVRRPSAAPGNIGRPGFPQAPYGMDGIGFGGPMIYGNTWGNSPNVFVGSPMPGPGSNFWPPSAGFGGPMSMGNQPVRPTQPQPVIIRLKTVQACKSLKGSTPDDFFDISIVKQQIDRLHQNEQPISEGDILDICETEGNTINGGGGFDIRKDEEGQRSIRYLEDVQSAPRPGEIGSPVIGSVGPVGMPRFQGPPPGF